VNGVRATLQGGGGGGGYARVHLNCVNKYRRRRRTRLYSTGCACGQSAGGRRRSKFETHHLACTEAASARPARSAAAPSA